MKIQSIKIPVINHFFRLLEKAKTTSSFWQCLNIAGLCFLGSLIGTYFLFRDSRFSISVHLAKVHFEDALEQHLDTKGDLRALVSWKITASSPLRMDKIMAKTGDEVKKGQVIAIANEAENRTALAEALQRFNRADEALKAAKSKRHSEKLSSEELKELAAQFEATKHALQMTTHEVEEDIIHAPNDGTLWLNVGIGQSVAMGTVFAEVEDVSKLAVSIDVPLKDAVELPSHAKVSLTFENAAPLELEAGIHYASAKWDPTVERAQMQLIFSSEKIPVAWRHQTVAVRVMLPALKNVALVDRSALVTQGNDSRILVMTPAGIMHWHRITHPNYFENKLVLKGVDSKTLRIVLPENIKELDKAVTLNVRPNIQES